MNNLETTIHDDIFPKAGGPAFPFVANERGQIAIVGMSLRDYFAAKAMQGLLSTEKYAETHQEKLASWAYQQADAMLAERDKKV